MVETSDISSIFWRFVENSIFLSQDDLLMSKEYNDISNISRNGCKFSLSFHTIWFDESDLVDLDYPKDGLKFYCSYSHTYIFPDIQQLFQGVYNIYDNIDHIGSFSTCDKSFKTSCKYNMRYDMISRCVKRINLFVDVNDQIDKINALTL